MVFFVFKDFPNNFYKMKYLNVQIFYTSASRDLHKKFGVYIVTDY